MNKPVNPIPEGHHTLTPHLIIKGAADAIAFYKKAFGAKEIRRVTAPDGKTLMHAELQIGDSRLFLMDEFLEMQCKGPLTLGGTAVTVHMFVEDVDKVFNQAVSAGAKSQMAVQDMFWGDRYGVLADPFGHAWSIATHKEDLTPDQLAERAKGAFAKGGCGQ